ncbi:hypothetical protein DUNSADRAFT_15445 [Dunaliella salina]|uniref:RRP12 N-terminal HEAT domain-containing protein n=1 Tax=Dunaliella salina TaxID=3046 RepID=A0ABQ7G5H6_DUNSA|nr:hypothetical protein DUNSADRAFT_15445 [Dunaliella salina]|eukprot:KAF5829827.1 hypothetical protein DUNSADRAFT_15445 [Dunaliella salina]
MPSALLDNDGGITEEVMAKHGNSGQPESQQVRKRAQACVVEVLAGLQASPALVPASEAITRVSQALLKGPENAARAAAAASNKQRSAAEERIAAAVSDALHLIGGLKMAAPLMAAPSVSVVVDLLFQLYPLKQPLLSRHATEALAALCESQASHVSPNTLAQILMVVIDAGDALWVRKDPDGILALTRLLEAGFLRLAEADPGLCAARLPRAFHALTPQLVAVLAALTEVIHAQGLPLTPTSFFAATMSALEKPDTRNSSLVVQAMCHLLSMVLPRVQQGVLRAKFVGATSLLASLLEEHRQQAPAAALIVLPIIIHRLLLLL